MRAARTVRVGDEEWPRSLARLPRPPPFLRVRGTLPGPGARAVAVVGSRRADPAGEHLARGLGAALARAGAWVISGGAAGVDGAAHRGALDAGGRTAVVLGGGLDHLYPPRHRSLFARVVEDGGALLSEVEDDERPSPWSFPSRNRIIAALSEAVVVVRAGERSGALATAGWARRLGLPLLAAAPEGPPEVAAGLAVLAVAGARVFGRPEEALERLGLGGAAAAGPEGQLDGPEAALWRALAGEPRHADAVARSAGLGIGPALAGLAELQLRGLAERLPGNRFARRG